MANPKRICSVAGCGKPHHGLGYCRAHHANVARNGTPHSSRTAYGSGLAWIYAHANYAGEECLIWPFAASKGRGYVKIGGQGVIAGRLMCELAHGEPPTPLHHAAHSCGNGHLGCTNPKHLRWATPVENAADMLLHGTRMRGTKSPLAKLTEADVLAIRTSTATSTELGRLYGMHPTTMDGIRNRRIWAWLP